MSVPVVDEQGKGGKEDEEVEGVGGDGREDGDEESCAVRMWS